VIGAPTPHSTSSIFTSVTFSCIAISSAAA
jgi:hypothetical protein